MLRITASIALLAALAMPHAFAQSQKDKDKGKGDGNGGGGKVEFKNDRFTYGIYGQARRGEKYLPGDVVCLAFDVEGLKVKNNGEVKYSMGFEVSKKAGAKNKSIQKREPQDYVAVNTLGTGRFPSFATWQIPRDEDAPGEYTMTITVKDDKTDKEATLTRKFEVIKTELGFVTLRFTAFGGDHAPPVAVAGQRLELRWMLVGFQEKAKMANVNISVRVLEDGKPVLEKPFAGDVESNMKDSPGLMIFVPYLMELNRPGKFKVELTAKCNNSKESVKETLDLTVLDPSKLSEK